MVAGSTPAAATTVRASRLTNTHRLIATPLSVAHPLWEPGSWARDCSTHLQHPVVRPVRVRPCSGRLGLSIPTGRGSILGGQTGYASSGSATLAGLGVGGLADPRTDDLLL